MHAFICQVSKGDHISIILIELHWLPIVTDHLQAYGYYFEDFGWLGPCIPDRYLTNVSALVPFKICFPVSAFNNTHTRLKTFGDRAFSVHAPNPKQWNCLQLNLRISSSLATFKKRIDIFLFTQHNGL